MVKDWAKTCAGANPKEEQIHLIGQCADLAEEGERLPVKMAEFNLLEFE